MTLFDDADTLLREALRVTAHAKPLDGEGRIRAGQTFIATITVENEGVGMNASTHARTAFVGVTLRVEATPFAAPLVDEAPVKDLSIEVGELIFGEASIHEVPMRATGALDAFDAFARVHVHGHLDLERFFSVGTVHQFTTEVRREVITDVAVEAFRELVSEVLPESFALSAWSFGFDQARDFERVVEDPSRFRTFVRERVVEIAEKRGLPEPAVVGAADLLEDLYLDVHESGHTGSLALALWFMGFDQGESMDFLDVATRARAWLEAFDTWEHRRELRLFKGFENDGVLAEPITVVDLPVIVDHGARTITLLAGSLGS